MTDLYRRVTGPWIGRLKQQANDIKAAELERLLNKLGDLGEIQNTQGTRRHPRKSCQQTTAPAT